MNKNLFSIGEISAIKGITVKALRFYEKIGLLKPCFINPSNRYRFYSIEQFILIDIIKAARSMDISPMELRGVMIHKDMRELVGLLNAQSKITAGKIVELKKIIQSMNGVQNAIRHATSSISRKNVYQRHIPQRDAVTVKIDRLNSDEEAIIEFSRFDRMIEEAHLINTYETGMLFKQDEKAGLYPERIFNTVEMDEFSNSSFVTTIPAGKFVCVCYQKTDARKQNIKLSRYLDRHGIRPKAILQIELLNNVFSMDANYFELQVLGEMKSREERE
jgi:MerR family transcriptional activator of bmr gene